MGPVGPRLYICACVSVRDLPPLPISEFFSSVFLKRRLQSITTREERNVQAGPGRRDGRADGRRRRRLPTRGGSFFLPSPAPPPPPPDIPIDRERCEVCLDTGRRIDEDPGWTDGGCVAAAAASRALREEPSRRASRSVSPGLSIGVGSPHCRYRLDLAGQFNGSINTEPEKMACTWFGEVCSCCS